jgi:two-component system sensor histidine kinase KdpD
MSYRAENGVMDRSGRGWAFKAAWGLRLGLALAAPAAVTLLAIPEEHPPTTVVAVLYVLAVVIAARVGGAPSGLVAAIVAFLALNFFFTSPLHTFAVSSLADLVVLLVFLIVAVVVGLLLSSALDAKLKAERREFEARLVNRLATRLLAGDPIDTVLEAFAEGLCAAFGFSGCEIETTLLTNESVTRGAADDDAHTVMIQARGETLGHIVVWKEDRRGLSQDEQSLVESLATQLALALEGVRLSEKVRRAELEAQASRLKAALFSGVTHDVKTPLAAIMASVTSLIDGREFSEVDRRAHLDTIKQEAERLHRVVNNLLDLARLRAGALDPVKKPSAIDELMESVINRLRPLFGDRPIEMRVGDDVPEVPMDVVQIDQVLTNLLENAVKFTPKGTAIALVAVGNDNGVRVTVSDRGPGIRQENRLRILEPFERGEAPAPGTGLGLAISNAVIVAHGGRMWVSDNPIGGAAFTFELPCSPAHANPADAR